MLHVTVHITEDLAEWRVAVAITESYGAGLAPVTVSRAFSLARTSDEWDRDPLWAALSALSRVSGFLAEESRRV